MSTALYAKLKRIAANQLKSEKRGHTLQPTALVHLRLVQFDDDMGKRSRSHFLALAATLMRQILVNHARGCNAQKRVGGALKVTLHDHSAVAPDSALEVLASDQALQELSVTEPRKSKIIELKIFGGLSDDEITEVLQISKSTVTCEARLGLALLYRLIQGQSA